MVPPYNKYATNERNKRFSSSDMVLCLLVVLIAIVIISIFFKKST